MANFYTTADGKAILDISVQKPMVDGTDKTNSGIKLFKLSEKMVNTSEGVNGPINVYAFRVVFTAGFALPFCQFVMSSNNREDLEQFGEGSIIDITYGEPTGKQDTFKCQTIGYHIKQSLAGDRFFLRWGGVFTKASKSATAPSFGISFLQDKILAGSHNYKGKALDTIKKAWPELCGTEVKIKKDEKGVEEVKETHSSSYWYRVCANHTRQTYFVNMFLHIDVRPSFPMACIDKDCNLVLKDFQNSKQDGPAAVFVASDSQLTKIMKERKNTPNVIRYVGKPEPISHRTYINRMFGYSEISARHIKDGNWAKFGSDMADNSDSGKSEFVSENYFSPLYQKPKWFQIKKKKEFENTCSTTQAKKRRKDSTVRNTSEQVVVDNDVPKSFHEASKYNVKQLANMSAVQLRLRVPEQYLNQVKVLDTVEIASGIPNDKINGMWVVEAMEHGFYNGKTANIVYLCRDFLNDEENLGSISEFAEALWKWLGIPAKDKANVSNMCYSARKALTTCHGILDARYLNEFQAYLISLRAGILSNFNIFGVQVNLNDAIGRTQTLRNMGNMLMIKLVRAFLQDPFATFVIDMLHGDSQVFGFLMMMISSIFGRELFTSISMLIADLRTFDIFLDNYNSTLKAAAQEAKPNYTAAIIAGVLNFQERPDGNIQEVLINKTNTPTRLTMVQQSPQEILADIKRSIVDNIVATIPEEVDIPIKDVPLEEDDLQKEHEELVEKIIDGIVNDLVDKGYVYNEKARGSEIYKGADIVVIDGTQKLSAGKLKKLLKGEETFTMQEISIMKKVAGETVKTRHWGTFSSFDDLTSFRINEGYADKYKTLNAIKSMSCFGQRIFVALPSSEENVIFKINSARCYELERNTMEISDIGYYDKSGHAIPYTIYYTNDIYDSVNLMLEMRRG